MTDDTLARKVAHVRRAAQTRTHHCHWPGCPKQVPPAMWGCHQHWYKLPARIRAQIWRTYQIGQEVTLTPSRAYVDAALAAQTWIREHLARTGTP